MAMDTALDTRLGNATEEGGQSGSIRVLIVEDEFLISEWVAQSLTEQGFVAQTASNAAEALRYLATVPIDVLFTDINLPGSMDGAALARRAREFFPHLPVVYASARATLLKPEARVPGSVVMPKPYEPALVGRLLAAAVRAAESQAPAQRAGSTPTLRHGREIPQASECDTARR